MPRSGDEVLSKAEQDAWAAVDRALATKDDAATVGQKVFKELEGVDKAVSAACSGVIRVLLQHTFLEDVLVATTSVTAPSRRCRSYASRHPSRIRRKDNVVVMAEAYEDAGGGAATATAGTVEQASPAAGSASGNKGVTTVTSSTAAGSQRADAAARNPSKGGKSRSKGTAKAATVRGSSARSRSTAPVPPTATPAPLQGAASVERTFQSLAAAFGETLVPVDRAATREEREAVWTGRVRHFHARIQAQQAVLMRRVTSAAASVYAGVLPLPPELNPVLRPLVSAVKKEPDAQRRGLSASRLARLATALLGDAARSERRDAGAMVLFGLASLSGKGQQQSLNSPSTAAAAATEETLMAVEVACDGATEMLRHAVSLAPSSSAVPTAPVLPPASPASAARPLLAPGSTRSDVRSGGGRGEGREEVVKDGGREGRRGRGGRGGKAVRDWALQTLAPLLRHPSGMGTQGGNTIGAGTAALPRPQRKLSAAEKKKSADEIRAIDLSAALGVAEALLQAARDRTAAAAAAAANPDRGERPLLGSLLLETSLAAGLLALARSGVPVSGEDEGADISAEPSHRRTRLRQHRRSGGGAGNAHDGGTPSVDGGGHAAAVAAATADAALIIARDAAALFPDGLWEGLRSDLLPALAAGACSGDVGGSGMRGGSFGDGGVGGIGVAGDVRAGLVLKEVVGGMGTGVVPYAARLLPVALRGMTDANEEVRGLLAGTFNELVKAVALAADDADDDGRAGDHKGGEDLGDGGVSTECTIDGQLHGQGKASAAAAAARVGKAAGDSVEEDGELIARHLVRGEPLPRLHRGLLPEALERNAAAGVTIRPYQWEGIAWLDFLRRIGAHGILADDMGLGKTLQALMAVAMCHHHHPGRRSLVVCPSMLVHHWKAECSRYFGDGLLRPVAYAGPPLARRRLAGRLGLGPAGNHKDRNGTNGDADGSQGPGTDGAKASAAVEEEEEPERANVVITSYNVLRTDADVLGKQGWLYLVLDEAHLLRNPATRTAKAARALRSNHRVGLTGTPIQNSVLELWSLFEFLMPGRSFQRHVARPVRAALSSDGDGRATVEGLQELEKLHRQAGSRSPMLLWIVLVVAVLPFVLRREKSEVLADLPSKIITEMVCDLTPEQRRLHNIWARGGDGGRVLAAVAQAEEMEAARLRAVASAAVAATAAAAAATATSERSAEPTGHVDGPTTAAPTPFPAVTATGGDSAAGDGGAATADSRGKNTTTEASRAAAPTGRLSCGAQTLACLSKLQLLCVHPSLVAPEEGTKRREMSEDVKLSGKLMALRELLWDAGIGKSESVDIGSSDSDTGTVDDSSSDDNEEEEEEKEEKAGRTVNDGKRRRSLEQRQSSSDSRKRGRNSRGGPEGGGSRAGYTNPSPAKAGPNSSTSSPGKLDTKRPTVGTAGSSVRAARSSSSRAPAESTGKGGKPPPTSTTRGKGSLPRQEEATTAGDGVASPLPGCKCLIFAQHKAALDVTESALLRPCFPGVKYLRMDGSVSQAERAAAVDRFSADPSVAILLLTTRVGHLGLNLSAASMVVFLEHDWNPQVDLQVRGCAGVLGCCERITRPTDRPTTYTFFK
ncbi:unnamed protein product [Ectocarpus sp. CCAP 1310/34]|nr:unnamed protein product [Ectocarpus sp. CCAP 1310/34]